MIKNAFFEQQKQCPVCNNKFTVTRVRSSACFVMQREADFHVKYRDIDPLLYSIWVCPDCQYANTDKDFVPEFKAYELDRLKKGLSLLKSEEPDFSGERIPPVAMRTVELALRTAMVRQAPAIVLAGFYMRGVWLLRDLGKIEEELKFTEQAKKLYQYSFEKEWGRFSEKMSDSTIMYLIGELNRRLGYNEEAIKWFNRAITNKDIKSEPEINRLVRDQWELAREEYKKQQANQTYVAVTSENISVEDTSKDTKEPTPSDDMVLPLPSAKKTRGSKVKIFLSLYLDQVDWLKISASLVYDKHKIFMEKETVARAIIDAVMEKLPELDDFKSEEELKNLIMNRLSV